MGRDWPRPKVVISRCIEHEPCRYNGDMIGSEIVRRLKDKVDFITVCPEMEIGLGVPRNPIRIVLSNDGKRLIQPSTGRDITWEMEAFAQRRIGDLGEIDGIILKSRSPSCGLRDVMIYPEGEGKAPISKEAGIFGREVLGRCSHLAVEDEARLRNIKIAEHFLTKLFILASFRQVESRLWSLVEFHTDNKLLLMAYSQKELRALGNILANREGKGVQEVFSDYEEHLSAALASIPKCTAPINVLEHALGYFSDKLKKEEKAFFLQSLEMYRDGRIPLRVCLSLMQSWIIRFEQAHLARQTFFEPFPPDLLEVGVTDSCAWRDMD